jgi:hypothetical protein
MSSKEVVAVEGFFAGLGLLGIGAFFFFLPLPNTKYSIAIIKGMSSAILSIE